MATSAAEPVPAGVGSAALVATYAAARAGVAGPDEMLGPDGAVRPAYRALVEGLAGIVPAEREAGRTASSTCARQASSTARARTRASGYGRWPFRRW